MTKRIAALFAALLLLPLSAHALTLGEGLTGSYTWPETASPEDAAYVYSYSYPSAVEDSEAAGLINQFYTYLVDDAMAFLVPMTVGGLDPAADHAATTISTDITCLNDAYLSVLVKTEHKTNDIIRNVYAGHTFTLTGDMAGSATNLPRMLGLLDDGETDEWLLQRQTDKADAAVRKLLWRAIQQGKSTEPVIFYDDLDQESLDWLIYPEEDFYLDADGNPVFFFQPGSIADESYGPVLFAIPFESIDDEL